jgi:hypothetical protein
MLHACTTDGSTETIEQKARLARTRKHDVQRGRCARQTGAQTRCAAMSEVPPMRRASTLLGHLFSDAGHPQSGT